MTKKIRILHLIDRLGNGGAETLLRTFASGYDRDRFELHIAGLRPALHSPLPEELRDLGVPVRQFNQRNSYDLPALFSLVSYVRENRIDLLHTHLLASDIMGRVAGFLLQKPVISTIHNARKDLDIEPLRRQLMERWTGRLICKRLVVVSDLIHDEIVDWFGLPSDRVIVIPNGVDMDRYYRGPEFDRAAVKRSLVGGEFPIIITVARLVPEKGQSHFIEAAKIVTDVRPEVRFVLVGDGPIRANLEAQAAALGLADKVVFTGFRSDVADLLAASEVFALSSMWEGMPISILEAMAASCPVVSTNVGGVGQVIQHNVNGLMVPLANPQALAKAIFQFLDDPESARRMSASALDWVNQHYSMHAWIHKCEELYLRELEQVPHQGSGIRDQGSVNGSHTQSLIPNPRSLIPTVSVELIKNPTTFARMQNEWSELVEQSHVSIFNSWAWLYPWHQWLSPSKEVRILAARNEKGKLIGLMPLYLEIRHVAGIKVRRLAFLGDKYVGSEYLDVIATCEQRETVTTAFALALHNSRDTWDVLDLVDMDSDSPTIQAFTEFFSHRSFDAHISECSVCPYESFTPDLTFDEFLRTTQRRSNYLRRSKWLQKQAGYKIDRIEHTEGLAPAMEQFFKLHAQRWAGDGGSDAISGPKLKAFHRLAASLLAEQKQLRLYMMSLGGQPVASVYAMRDHDKFIYYQSGRDPNWEDRSVGLALVGETFKDAIEDGLGEYDFLRGVEQFKSDWTKKQRQTIRIRIHHRSMRGNLLDIEAQALSTARALAKKVLSDDLAQAIHRLRLKLNILQ